MSKESQICGSRCMALASGENWRPQLREGFHLSLPLRLTSLESGAPDVEAPLFFGFDKNRVAHYSFH